MIPYFSVGGEFHLKTKMYTYCQHFKFTPTVKKWSKFKSIKSCYISLRRYMALILPPSIVGSLKQWYHTLNWGGGRPLSLRLTVTPLSWKKNWGGTGVSPPSTPLSPLNAKIYPPSISTRINVCSYLSMMYTPIEESIWCDKESSPTKLLATAKILGE